MNTSSSTRAGFFAQTEGEWNEAFNPPPPSLANTKKAWERQPVSAHAPRLQGQKIWKRTGLRSSQSLRDNNNHSEKENAAQLELERGGQGARKRVRTKVLLDTQNGGEVLWAEEKEFVGVDGGVGSPRKVDEDVNIGREGMVVPRKRTNTNHLVTPKRGVKRTPLENLGGDLKGGLVAQMMRASPKKILVVEAEEKPARRRRSMRKSGGRRLTTNAIEEEEVITPLVEVPVDVENVPESIVPDPAAEKEILVETLEDINQSPLVLEQEVQLESVAETNLVEADIISEDLEVVQNTTLLPVESEAEVEIIQESAATSNSITDVPEQPTVRNSSIPDLQEQQTIEAPKIEEITLETSIVSVASTPQLEFVSESPQEAIDTEIASIDTPATVSPTVEEDNFTHVQSSNSTILATSITSHNAKEETSNPILSPTKAPATPRRAKKATMQPQSIRRSTRSKPPSTLAEWDILNEIQPVQLLPSPLKATVGEQLPVEVRETAGISEIPNTEQSVLLPITGVETTDAEIELVSDTLTPLESSVDALPHEHASESETDANEECENTHILPPLSDTQDQTEMKPCVEAEMEVTQAENHSDESSSDKPDEDDAIESLEATIFDSTANNNREDSEEAEPKENGSVLSSSSLCEEETITQDLEVTVLESDVCLEIPFSEADDDSLLLSNQLMGLMNETGPDDTSEGDLEEFEPVSFGTVAESILDNATMELDTFDSLPGSSTPDPTTTALVETILENAPSAKYDEDDTDLLRNFLTRVKANKEAKAQSTSGKRKQSLPHSPIQLPLGSEPSPAQSKIDFDVSVPEPSPAKRRKRGESSTSKDDMTEPQSIRRSGRTRLPIKTSSLPAPSFIPVRRLGQDGDNTITLRKSEDKELAAITKINTVKNKGALSALDLLGKLGTQKENPASRHQALKLKFDEKSQTSSSSKSKSKKKKTVVWAEEIAQFQNADEKELDAEKMEVVAVVGSKEKKEKKERKKEIAVSVAVAGATPVKVVKEKKSIPVRSTAAAAMTAAAVGGTTDEKKTPVKVGVRSSRISMGMVANGTPAPKRKVRGSARS